MVALPAASAHTTPTGETFATAGLLLLHVTTRPVSTFPAASFATALACALSPGKSENEAGETASEATCTCCTSTRAAALTPCADAVSVALPEATARTVPPASTAATAASEVVQTT